VEAIESGPDVVVARATDGTCRLVDLDGNICVLDADAARLFDDILSAGPAAAACGLARHHRVDVALVERDVTAFVEALRRERLVGPDTVPRSWARAARRSGATAVAWALSTFDRAGGPPQWRATVHLAVARASVAAFGWARTAEAWDRGNPAAPHGIPETESGELRTMVQALRERSRRSLLRPECKELSLACLAMARSGGLPAELVVGLRPVPLRAHAWVELHGRPLLDDAAALAQFAPLARYRGAGAEPV
jgi:hypothetical protein